MKAFVVTILILGYSFVGFIATIMAALSRDAEFYVPFIPITTIGLIIITSLAIYGKMKNRKTKISATIFISLCVISVAIYEGYQAYVGSLEIVSTQDVDLSVYQPFAENTKAVSLGEDSTFKIKDKLPKLDGATALYPVYAAFAQAVYPKKDYLLQSGEVVSNQTDGAFNGLIKGEVDIIFMAHPSENQMKLAENKGLKLSLTPIGREAFVFFVHQKNPIEELSIEQIQGIYSGKIKNWKELGGKNKEIRAFQRPEGSGSQSALIRLMKGIPLMDPPSDDIISGMGGIIRETTNYQNRTNAIGYSFRYFSQEMVQNGKIKNIAVEGVLPTKENIRNESYPIVAEFYAITDESNNNPHVHAFIEWMQSEQGQKIVEQTGYVPVK